MDYIIERIVRHTDIDTRRAMGLNPGKLVMSDLNLNTNFVRHGCARKIHLGGGISMTIHPTGNISWVFRGSRLATDTEYFFQKNGVLSIWTMCKTEASRHPDFNEDGTLKNWQSV